MMERARVPIYFAMAQVAIVSITIPAALGFDLLAAMGVIIFLALWAALKSVDRSLEAFHYCSHFVYLVSLIALSYAVLGLNLAGALTVYSTAAIVLGAAYLLGTKPALFWATPCVLLVGFDAFTTTGPDYPAPPVVSFVVRTLTLATILAFAISFRSAHDQQAAALQKEARMDPLTGLANRLALDEALVQALDRAVRFERRGAIIFADLDGMKSINDNFGHEAGDLFLREIADRIRTLTRAVDTPARLGGDEFVILVSEFTDPKGAEILARRLAESVARPWCIDGHSVRPAASIGIVEFTGDSGGPTSLLRLADDAMYTAKRSASAQICVARDGVIAEVS